MAENIKSTYYQKNKERILVNSREYYIKNKDKLKVKRDNLPQEKKDGILTYAHDYYIKNKNVIIYHKKRKKRYVTIKKNGAIII